MIQIIRIKILFYKFNIYIYISLPFIKIENYFDLCKCKLNRVK